MNVAHQLDGENTICGRWWVTERSSLQRKTAVRPTNQCQGRIHPESDTPASNVVLS